MTKADELKTFDYSGDLVSKEAVVERIREEIIKEAGDQQAILGTTTDATQLLLYGFCQLVTKLNKAENLAQVREAAASFTPQATSFLEQIEQGAIKLPFMAKGLDSVVADIAKRSTAVANVLEKVHAHKG